MSHLDLQYKFLFLGETSVGKTSILLRYVDDNFNSFLPTVGVDVRYKYIMYENKKIRLDIWDTAGQERFKNIAKNYFRGANGVILVFDISNKESLSKLKFWLYDCKQKIDPETELVIAENKIDIESERVISKEAIKEFGEKNNIEIIPTSAKTGEGIEAVFSHLISKLFLKKDIGVVPPNEDEFTQRRGSYLLNNNISEKDDKKKKKEKCNC